ncbi:unnamed protein product, partial [Polarella glacialis]
MELRGQHRWGNPGGSFIMQRQGVCKGTASAALAAALRRPPSGHGDVLSRACPGRPQAAAASCSSSPRALRSSCSRSASAGGANPMLNLKPAAVEARLRELAKSRGWQESLSLLLGMRSAGLELGSRQLNAAIRACGWKHAQRLLEEACAEGIQPDVNAHNAIVASWSRERRWVEALAIQRNVIARSIMPNVATYGSTISACAASNWAVALVVALLSDMSMRSVEPNMVVFNAAISAAGACGDWQAALSFLCQAQEQRLQLDVIAYCSAIAACSAESSWAQAIVLFEQAVSNGVTLNTVTCNAAVSACAAGSHWQGALWLLQSMFDAGPAPDVITYGAAISACRGGRRWQTALGLLGQLQLRGLQRNVVLCSAAISACEASGCWEQALVLLSDMRRMGPAPNLISYNAAISACEKGQQWERALQLLADASGANMEPGVIAHNAAISACEKGRQWAQALELLKAAQAGGCNLDTISYSAAISACDKGWQWSYALTVLQEMCRIRLPTEAVAYNAVLTAYGRCAQNVLASQLLTQMQKDSRLPDPSEASYNAVISACAAGGTWHEAVSLICDMRLGRLIPSLTTYNSAADACGRCGALEPAWIILTDLEAAGLQPDQLSLLAVIMAAERSRNDGLVHSRLGEALRRASRLLRGEARTGSLGDSDLANSLGPPVAVAEALDRYERLSSDTDFVLRRLVYRPAALRLAVLVRHVATISSGNLRDAMLERQNTLGDLLTCQALADFNMMPPQGGHVPWLPSARFSSRAALREAEASQAPDETSPCWGTEPAARSLPAWGAAAVRLARRLGGVASSLSPLRFLPVTAFGNGAAVGSGELAAHTADAQLQLPALYVEHDRSSHSERRVLLAILDAAATEYCSESFPAAN